MVASDSPKAIYQFRVAERLQPGGAAVHLDLARTLGISGQRAEAIEELRIAARLQPDNPKLRALLARLPAGGP